MKKIFNTPALLTLVSMVFLFSCSKIDIGDILRDHDKAGCVCKVRRLKYLYSDSPVVTEIRYNKWGDPDSIISTYANDGHPNIHLFYYDSRHRLTEYISLLKVNGTIVGYWDWSRYNYDNKGRVLWDSSYYMGNYIDGRPIPPSPYQTNLMMRYEYFYDQYNRITEVVQHWSNSDYTYTYNYAYDTKGNLEGSEYDNKVNIYQTHKIWQFLARNYSINNPVSAWWYPLGYNKYGLPVSYSGYGHWLNLYGDNIQVEYDCR